MAFPTSSLTNNQVHKEGNRAFVYDSTLGVWDQVRETDRTENKILQGEIGAGVSLTNATFPAGHVIQVVTNTTNSYVTSSGTTEAWETDANDIHITVTAGNMVVCWITGGMLNAETSVAGYWTKIRFYQPATSNPAPQDIWTSAHIGGNFTPDLYHPGLTIYGAVSAYATGEMLIKRGVDSSGGHNTSWSSDSSNYGPIHKTAMEIQQ